MSEENDVFMRGYALLEVVLSPHERLLAIELGYSELSFGPYEKMKLKMTPDMAKTLAKELAELAEELGSTHH